MEKNLKELSKSKYKNYEPLAPEGKLEKLFYSLFIKNSFFKSFWSGVITTAVIMFFFMRADLRPYNIYPVALWFGLIFVKTLIVSIYWKLKGRKLDRELLKIEGELKDISKELEERQKVFEKIKKEMLEEK
jgi:hypothetical protein